MAKVSALITHLIAIHLPFQGTKFLRNPHILARVNNRSSILVKAVDIFDFTSASKPMKGH